MIQLSFKIFSGKKVEFYFHVTIVDLRKTMFSQYDLRMYKYSFKWRTNLLDNLFMELH